ncbi:MAG: hypothetical protein ACOYOB_15420 [Myxococcota bacterium]
MTRNSLIWIAIPLALGAAGCEGSTGTAVNADVANDVAADLGDPLDVPDSVEPDTTVDVVTDVPSGTDTTSVGDVKCGSGNKTYPQYAAQCVGIVGCQKMTPEMCACSCSLCNGPVCVEVLCGDGPECWGPDVTQDQTDTPDATSHRACAQNSDCVAVETQCCDHCNGGEAIAMNAKYADLYKKPPSECNQVACTEMACSPVAVDCVDDQCEIAAPSPACAPALPGKLCVRGTVIESGEELKVGDPVQATVYPKGCFSSSCTQAVTAACGITMTAGSLQVSAEFCLKDTSVPGGGCTADCSGGSFATCNAGVWTAGTHVVSMGDQQVSVTVPSTLPFGGTCAGSQF